MEEESLRRCCSFSWAFFWGPFLGVPSEAYNGLKILKFEDFLPKGFVLWG